MLMWVGNRSRVYASVYICWYQGQRVLGWADISALTCAAGVGRCVCAGERVCRGGCSCGRAGAGVCTGGQTCADMCGAGQKCS